MSQISLLSPSRTNGIIKMITIFLRLFNFLVQRYAHTVPRSKKSVKLLHSFCANLLNQSILRRDILQGRNYSLPLHYPKKLVL